MALTTNLVSYWKFDESSGNAADATATGNTLTNNGTTTFSSSPAKINNACHMNGSSQYFSITDGAQSGLGLGGDITLATWIYLGAYSSSTGYFIMGKCSGGTNSSYGMHLNIDGTAKLELSITNVARVSKSVSWTPSINTWYHVVAVYDNAAGTVDFYVDGSQLGTQQSGLPTTVHSSAVFFGIGNWGDVDKYFPGSIDEAGVWSRKLSNGEISQLYNSGSGLAYPFQNNYTATLTETMTLIESAPRSISRAVTETVTLTDPTVSAANIKVKTLIESMTLTDPPVAASRTGPTSWTEATLQTSIWTQQFPTP